jgi:transcriptional regulator with XRE-family HTH domain
MAGSVARRMAVAICGEMKFPAKLKRLMSDHRLSQARVAKHLDCSQAVVGKWTRGESEPDLSTAAMLAALLGVSLDYLADDSRDEPAPGLSAAESEILSISRTLGLALAKERLLLVPKGAAGVRMSDDPGPGRPSR